MSHMKNKREREQGWIMDDGMGESSSSLLILIPFSPMSSLMSSMLSSCASYDSAGTGLISYDDLKKVLSKLGEEVSDEDVEEMVAESKADAGNQKVHYKLFVESMYADQEEEEEQ